MIPDMEVIVAPQFMTWAEASVPASERDEAGQMREPLTVMMNSTYTEALS